MQNSDDWKEDHATPCETCRLIASGKTVVYDLEREGR